MESSGLMLLLLDNYDSFTFNLAQYLGELGAEVVVKRNDEVDLRLLEKEPPQHIVISPGPGTPDDAGLSCEVIRRLGGRIPILGVCLGHQCIGQVYGGRVERAPEIIHGKTSDIHHHRDPLFQGLENPFSATRYHSLLVASDLPECLEKTAWTDNGLIMGLRHRAHPVWGVQFHPESILSFSGKAMLRNFLTLCQVAGTAS